MNIFCNATLCDLVSCDNDFLTFGDDLLSLGNDLLSHGNEIKMIAKPFYVPSWSP